MYILSLFNFFKEIKSQLWQERAGSLRRPPQCWGIHRFYGVPFSIVPGSVLPSSSQSLWPASQCLWLWCVVQAVLWPGCCCCGLGFTHQVPGGMSCLQYTFPQPQSWGWVCLCVSYKWPSRLLCCVFFGCPAGDRFALCLSFGRRARPSVWEKTAALSARSIVSLKGFLGLAPWGTNPASEQLPLGASLTFIWSGPSSWIPEDITSGRGSLSQLNPVWTAIQGV